MRKYLLFIIFAIGVLFPSFATAQETEVNLYLFWSKTCPHCAKEKVFLQEITPDYPNLKIHDYEVNNKDNALLLQRIGKELNIETSGVPITIIGKSHFVGYEDDETTGKVILRLIEKVANEGDADLVGTIIRNDEYRNNGQPQQTTLSLDESVEGKENAEVTMENIQRQVKIPILGVFDTKSFSLPVLTVIIAGVDGFNPCAMWTLLFLISLLLGMKDRKRMWILGSAFIVSSAFVYFLFLSAWLNLFLFLGFIIWVRIAIGVVALGAGGYYLYDFINNKTGGCKVTDDEKRKAIFEKLKSVTQRKGLFLALAGIIALAFAVNLVELICSAGFPAIYTQVLSMANLPRWQYYLYLLLYILVFMLDDLFIFFTAMLTLKATGIQNKYSRYSHLIGGILMVIIGFLMLFKPDWLMFA